MAERKPSKFKAAAKKVAKAARAAVVVATAAGAIAATEQPGLVPQQDPTDFLITPAELQGVPESVLLPYQQEWIADQAQLKIAEKSRRVGLTWAEAADNVLTAAAEGGSNVFYISATQDMAREYIEACAMWAKVFDHAASEVTEGLYDDGDTADGSKKFIKTFEVVFPKSGKRITALSSRPTNLRGKQGVIVIDEAAFHQKLDELLKAAMAMLLWGDKVHIISTHDGAENAFAALIEEVRAGKRGTATVHRIQFRQAVQQGLYRRVCMRKGKPWSQADEDRWVEEAYAFYGDAAAEELDVIPSQGAGAYLSLALIERRMVEAKPSPTGWLDKPVIVRGKWDDAFAFSTSEDVRRFAIAGWLREEVTPYLMRLHPDRRHCLGLDFARNQNLTVLQIQEEDLDGVRRPLVTIELFNCPFTSQEEICIHVIENVPRFRGAAFDAGGNGAALAEKMAQRFGTQLIEQVKLNDPFYLLHMPKLKAGLQDGTLVDLPRDVPSRDDLRAIRVINGVPKLPSGNTGTSSAARAAAADAGGKLKRHGDFAIATFLCTYAWFREAGEIEWTPAPSSRGYWDGQREKDDDDGWQFDRKSGV